MTPVDVALKILNFTAAEFTQGSSFGVADRLDMLLMSEFEGIAINAPAHVAAGSEVPIAVAVRFDSARAWDVPLARNTALVATNLDTGRVLVSELFKAGKKRHGERAPLDRGQRPLASQLEGVAADISWSDFAMPRDPAEPGTWRIAVVYRDWVSNEVEITVAGEPRAPDVREPWPPAANGSGLPSYLPLAGTMDGRKGVANFGLDVGEANGRQVLRATGRVQIVLRRWMASKGVMLDRGTQQEVIATLPITMIWLEQNASRSVTLRFVVPVYAPPPAPGTAAQANFSVDLLSEAENYRVPPGSYAVWLLVDGRLHGPQLTEIPKPS